MTRERTKRRRVPRNSPQKSAVMNFRVTPETRALLEKAAQASGRTVSAETEHQLRRALSYTPPGPAYAVLRTVSAALESLLSLEHPQPHDWLKEPALFDRTIRYFVAALEMFRPPERPAPPNAVAAPAEVQRHIEDRERSLSRAALLEVMAQIARADESAPLAKQSRQQRAFAAMKADLGEMAERPALRELIPLAQRIVETHEAPEASKGSEAWAFLRTIASLRDQGVFDRLVADENAQEERGRKSAKAE